MLEARGLAKDLALYSPWSRLFLELDVYGGMELVVDMATDAKRLIRSNTFGMTFTFLYFS